MSKVTVEDSVLGAIANAIRGKNSASTMYKPSEMASAISSLPTYPEPTGAKTISANGTGIDVKDYATANVSVPNTYPPRRSSITGRRSGRGSKTLPVREN